MLEKEVDYFLYKNGIYFIKRPVIISGGAKGADALGERYAKEKGYGLKIMNPNWNRHYGYAGHLRNKQMAEIADCCILFWDGLSKGTEDMMKIANKNGLITKVVYYSKKE